MEIFKTVKIIVFAIVIVLSFISSNVINNDTRIIEGQVIDKLTKKPLKTTIEFHRKGNAWHVRSGESGWYYISLKPDQAYAIKILEKDFRYYTKAFYLEPDSTNTPFKKNIELMPKKRKKPVEGESKGAIGEDGSH